MFLKKEIRNAFLESIRIKNDFLSDDSNIGSIGTAVKAIIKSVKRGGKVLVFGNGGSAADSQHLAAEMVVRFEKERKAFPCIALTTDTSILTAVSNDYGYDRVFSRQIEALGAPGDVVIAISTSGSSESVIEAVRTAKKKKIKVIALTGRDGGCLRREADISIHVKEEKTARIQEVHITIIHIICKAIESLM